MGKLTEIHKKKKDTKKAKRDKGFKDGRRFLSSVTGEYYRSSWEVELIELLTDLGIRFEYENKRFYFRAERESYLPDIYLPDYGVYIEIKGYMDRRSEKRCRLFRKYCGTEYGFFLYMQEERDIILKSPTSLIPFLEVAREECMRRRMS